MPVSPISAIAPAVAGKSSSPERIQEAAEQFESLLISQMLKSAREGGGWGIDEEEEGQEGTPLMEMAEEQLGNILASQGGLGLARLIVQQMTAAIKNPVETAHTPSVVSDKDVRVAESHADR